MKASQKTETACEWSPKVANLKYLRISKRIFEFPHNFKQSLIKDSPPSHILTLGCQLAVPSRLSIEKWGEVWTAFKPEMKSHLMRRFVLASARRRLNLLSLLKWRERGRITVDRSGFRTWELPVVANKLHSFPKDHVSQVA